MLKLERWLKIYSDGSHNALTDICWFKGQPYCTFRHATNHLSEDGRVLILRGTESGDRWQVVASIRSESDTRDPKLMVTPEGLFCYSFMSERDQETGEPGRHASGYSFSEDGEHWSPWEAIEEDYWYWRPRWYEGRGYVAAYQTKGGQRVMFKTTQDGRTWQDVTPLAEDDTEEQPNEVAFDFAPDGTCCALIRREYGTGHPLLGRAKPPYTDWAYIELPVRLQGPCLWFVEEEVYISGRWYQPSGYVNTAIFKLEDDMPVCQIVLPSGGDTSYMGVAQHPEQRNRYWLTYYSSHEHSPEVNSHEHPADVFLCDVVFEG